MIRAWNPTKTRNIITIMAAMFAIVASLLTPLCAYGYGLTPIFLNMDNATYNDVRAEAEYQTDALNKPRYSNVPVTINPPEHQTFEGDFTPSSPNGSLMAIFSDDGCNVYVTPSGGTEQLVLNKIDQGQALPNLDEYTPPSLIRLPSSIVNNQPVYEWSAGVTYHIKIEYSNILYTGSLDIDGCTLFAYEGGGSIGDDTTAPVGSITINNGDDFTTSTSVTLSLFSMDTGTGVYMMRFSNDGSSWSAWENYAATRNNWQLTSGDGEKTVYAQYKDRAGNVSSRCFDMIILRASPGSKTIHVNAATGSDTNDGFSWSTAKATITAGVGAAVTGEQVWVAAGTYNGANIKFGVELYGGFDTADVNFSDRDWKTNQTIINGGSGGCNVSNNPGATSGNSVIDGFVMQNCTVSAWGGSLTISNNKISNPLNMCNISCSGTTLTVSGNTVSGGSYGINCYASDIEVFNNIFSGTSYGIFLQGGTNSIITNNTIVNTITNAISNYDSTSPTICNNIITSSSYGAQGVHNNDGSSIPTLNSNDIYNPNGTNYYNCTSSSDIHQNPQFVNSSNGDYHLSYGSPCIDAGVDESSVLTTDLDGYTRPSDGNFNGTAEFDIGAYEFVDEIAPAGTIRINSDDDFTTSASVILTPFTMDTGTGVYMMRFSNDGSSWSAWENYATTINNWQLTSGDGEKTVYAQYKDRAGNVSSSCFDVIILRASPGSKTIHVNAATGSDTNDGFSWSTAKATITAGVGAAVIGEQVWVAAGTYNKGTLKSGVELYGGFDTAEVNFSDRDWKTNQTIINGGTNGCTVSIATGTPPHSVIDGFIMQNCSLAVWHGSLTISNNKISNPSNMRGIYCFGATLTVFGNTVSGGPYGLNCYSSDIEVFNNIISDTSYGILLQSGTSAIITNNTIVNTITYGIGNSSSYSPTICNNIITSSSNGAYGVYNYNGSSIPTLDHNDVYNPNGTSYYNCTSSSDIHQDPLFEDSSNGNYCLQYDSPCIDAGIDESSILTTDLDGHTRPLDGNLNGTAEFDIGAYEFMQPSVPTITITTPPAIVHKADATTATIHIAGTASDTGSGINHVEVVVVPSGQNPPTSHPWNSIIVTGTENWQCDWSCSQSGDYTIWAYVVNNTGSYAQISQNLTVTFVGVVYVKPGGSGSGTSWNDAIGSVQSGINTASSQSKEVWVAAGTYYESINITNNVALYGGFFGSETAREQRNWSANTTTLDGLNSLGVMTISNVVGCIVDGFTICNGKTVMGLGSGSGISCYSATATIANNIICKNNATFGGGLYSSSSTLTVVGNVFVGNSAISGGGIYYTNTSGSIANNTIIDNEVSDNGGGIYLESGSPALSNNIVGFNIGGGICKYSGTPTFTKNDVYGNTSYAYSWKIWSQNDTEIGLDLNPAISDPMITNVGLGDWHIASTSACHDPVGTTLAVSMDKDIDSESRVYGSTVDIGADEWNGTDPTSILIEYPTRWKAVGAGFSSPLVADLIPGDNGVKEIAVISNKQWDGSSWFDDGKIYVWKADGTEFTSIMRNGKCLIAQFQSGDAGFPICSRDYLNDDHENTLSTADIDGLSSVDNAHLELIAPTNSDYSGNTIHSFGYDADASVFKPIAGWPVTADYNFWGVAAAIGDANLDGTLEVVAGDESCYVFSWNPAGGPYLWRQLTGTEASSIWFSSVALGDVNYFADTNRFPDAVVGSQHDSPLFAFCGDSWGDTDTYPSGSTWPKETDSAIMSSPAIGLIDSDSDNDIAVCTYGGRLYMWLSSTQTWTYYQLASSTGEKSSPVITELNSQRCVVVGCNNNRVYAVKSDGTPITGWPFEGISLSWTAGSKVVASPAIADVMNTGSPQIVVACADGRVYALWADGYNHANGPIAKVWVCKQSGSAGVKIESTPAICSLDGTQVSMIIGSTDGIYKANLYSLPSGQTFVPNSARWPWPTFHRDNARTGCQTTDTNPAPPVSASIYGKITSSNGNPVQGAKVYVRVSSGLELPAVYGRPGETRADPVLSAGDAATLNDEFDEGQYCLSQLPPNQTYKITVTDANGGHITTTDVSVTTGKTDQDIQLVP